MARRNMAADHHELVIYRPMRDRNARQGGHAYGARHTRHHRHRNSGLGARQHLLISAREDEGVPAFEADHEAPGPGPVDHDVVDRVLGHGPPVRDLGRINDFHVRRQLREQFRRREPVGDHDVGLGEQATAAHGDQFGVAGTAADQRHPAADDVGELSELSGVMTPVCSASRMADRIAADRRCSPPASTPTDNPA